MGGTDITDEPPFRRDVGMVFQSFALFPHMTVKENIAYGLRVSNESYSEAEIDDRVDEMLELIELPEIKERMPDQISGGQQQRVALARALALNPKALLLDEPLANLDEKLREQMQAELSRIQKELGVTTVFVTHNQEEAMTMSDRIVVMNDGKFEQVGAPDDVYDDPRSLFVADFIGKTNVFRGTVTGGADGVLTVEGDETLQVVENDRADATEGTEAGVVVRPEAVQITSTTAGAEDDNTLTGEVSLVQRLGGVIEYRVQTGAHELLVTMPASATGADRPARGDQVTLTFPAEACRVLTTESVATETDVGEEHLVEA
jgi:ABC-type Fe3+/spermidine/putrescine transport system ATPase subunit